jgi:hypothetical protein
VLLPGGYVTWVVMPRLCLWELAAALRGDWRTAIRRLRPGGVLASVEGVHFRTYYFTPSQVRRAFGAGYRLAMLEGLSVFTPPADYKGFARHHPRLYAVLRALDERLAPRLPWRAWGDFFGDHLGAPGGEFVDGNPMILNEYSIVRPISPVSHIVDASARRTGLVVSIPTGVMASGVFIAERRPITPAFL